MAVDSFTLQFVTSGLKLENVKTWKTVKNIMLKCVENINNRESVHTKARLRKNANFFIQETISHQKVRNAGYGTSSENVSLVKTVILATISRYVKTIFLELVAIFADNCILLFACNGKEQGNAISTNTVN